MTWNILFQIGILVMIFGFMPISVFIVVYVAWDILSGHYKTYQRGEDGHREE